MGMVENRQFSLGAEPVHLTEAEEKALQKELLGRCTELLAHLAANGFWAQLVKAQLEGWVRDKNKQAIREALFISAEQLASYREWMPARAAQIGDALRNLVHCYNNLRQVDFLAIYWGPHKASSPIKTVTRYGMLRWEIEATIRERLAESQQADLFDQSSSESLRAYIEAKERVQSLLLTLSFRPSYVLKRADAEMERIREYRRVAQAFDEWQVRMVSEYPAKAALTPDKQQEISSEEHHFVTSLQQFEIGMALFPGDLRHMESAMESLMKAVKDIQERVMVAAEWVVKQEMARHRITMKRRGVDAFDVGQDCAVQMVRAMETFDWSRGLRFVTWAYKFLRATVAESVGKHASKISSSVEVAKDRNYISAIRDRFVKDHGRDPSVAEVWELARLKMRNISMRRVREILASEVGASFDARLRHGDGEQGLSLGEVVADAAAEEQFLASDRAVRSSILRDIIEGLDYEARMYYRLRTGVLGDEILPMAAIAQRLGRSETELKQIASKARYQLKTRLKASPLKDDEEIRAILIRQQKSRDTGRRRPGKALPAEER